MIKVPLILRSEKRQNYHRSPLRLTTAKSKTRGIIDRVQKCVLTISNKYVRLFDDPRERLYAYFFVLTILSFVSRLFDPLPQFAITQKRNIFNDSFVKLALLWTISFVLPFIFLVSSWTTKAAYYDGLSKTYWLNSIRQASRILINILLWYLITGIFVWVERWTGSCTIASYESPIGCAANGGRWITFEISGHSFLLVYCSMTIVEELAVLFRDDDDWGEEAVISQHTSVNNTPKVEIDETATKSSVIIGQYNKLYAMTALQQILFVGNALLLFLWDFMFLITALYYHTWDQKVCGLAFAAACWYLTYGSWYRCKFSPGMPGK